MVGWELWRSKLDIWWWHVQRRIPHLVWHNDEVDVTITFRDSGRILDDATFDPEFFSDVVEPTRLYEAERILYEIGLRFDTGSGTGGRDWEFDWSLKGPVSVRFRRRTRKPERRISRRLSLVGSSESA